MIIDLFLSPGRLIARLFFLDRKRAYRSLRKRSGSGPGVFLLSLLVWLALVGGVLYAVDQTGLLHTALDAGIKAATQSEPLLQQPATSVEPEPAPFVETPATKDQTAAEHLTINPSQEVEMWLVVLHTIPKKARDEAERRQAQYRVKGLVVEILDTDAFPKLQSGYWIIAQGPFDDRTSALAAADIIKTFNTGLRVLRGL
ncbi:MAG: hypothetical protein AMR96_01850 [Candidatus Adiutrix intracellularis]|nr:MAG: hypothetical protein AMR96_01850 [Candidatus Adiutrix intracellularis]